MKFCRKTTYQIRRVKPRPEKPRPTLEELENIAYKVMITCFEEQIRLYRKDNRKYLNNAGIISKGPCVFYEKIRLRPVSLTRYLIMVELLNQGKIQEEIGQIFGLNRTCVSHAKQLIKDELSKRFDTDFKNAILMFRELV